MSNEALRWAFEQDVKPSSAKFVLVALANCVRAGGASCFPSMQHLIKATAQDRKTVGKSVSRLRTLGLIVDSGERRGRTGQVIVYTLNMPETGHVEGAPKRAASEGGRSPKTDTNTPVFPGKDPPFSPASPPKTGYGTLPNREGTGKNPHSGGEGSPASRPDGRGGDTDVLLQQVLASRVRPMTDQQEQTLRADVSRSSKPIDALQLMLNKRHWNALPDMPEQTRRSRHAGLNDKWKGESDGRQVA